MAIKSLIKAVIAVGGFLLSASVFAGPVNINTASAEELAENLSGIGIGKATAIVEYRNLHGAFGSADQLTAVKGIGKATLEKNRDQIVLSTEDKAG